MSKPLSKIPIRGDGVPRIAAEAPGLVAYLQPMNSPEIVARLGEEREVYADATFKILHGETFVCRSGKTLGMRYMYMEAGETVGCLNVTRIGREVVASNVVVREDRQRRGIATALFQRALEDFPKLVADSSMTLAGAALMGRLPEEALTSMKASQVIVATTQRNRPWPW